MKDKYFKVLDHGFVALKDFMGDDAAIEQAARVSYGKGTRKASQTRGLLRYLRRHLHSTPFEQVQLQFHVSCPIFVMRQWIRHRTGSFNEYSARYSVVKDTFYLPDKIRSQSQSNKQGSEGEIPSEFLDAAHDGFDWANSKTYDEYLTQLGRGVAREQARNVLPVSVYTEFYWSVNLHNLFHFLGLRADGHAQEEIREYAKVIGGIVKSVAPLAFEAWFDYQFAGTKFSKQEMQLVKAMVIGNVNHATLDILKPWCKSVVPDLSDRELEEFFNKLYPKEMLIENEFPTPTNEVTGLEDTTLEVL
jgi:thymidylate synthase (FAD)